MRQLQGGTAIRNRAATKPADRRSRREHCSFPLRPLPPHRSRYSWNIPIASSAERLTRTAELLASVRTAHDLLPALCVARNNLPVKAAGLARCLPPAVICACARILWLFFLVSGGTQTRISQYKCSLCRNTLPENLDKIHCLGLCARQVKLSDRANRRSATQRGGAAAPRRCGPCDSCWTGFCRRVHNRQPSRQQRRPRRRRPPTLMRR